MHAPDGFLTVGTAVATGAMSAGAVGYSLRRTRDRLRDRQIPLAGITAAFVFAAQMINFPVGAGTTGHLLGAAMAAILLGPMMGCVVLTSVIGVQALMFADGGLTALGYNTLNMAVIPTFGGYAVFRMGRRILPRSRSGAIGATAIAAGTSVVLGAMAFSLQWLFGATAPVPFDTVFAAMVGVHLAIGIGEGFITAIVIGTVLTARPDLVYGMRDLGVEDVATRQRMPIRAFALAAIVVSFVLAMVVSQVAAEGPDGLESVAAETGISATAVEQVTPRMPFSDYATAGLDNEALSLAVAGAAGVIVTLALLFGLMTTVGDRTQKRPDVTASG